MKWISSLIQNLQTGKGLLLFLVSMVIIWLSGYYFIDAVSHDEWSRCSRQLYFSRSTLIVAILFMAIASVTHFRHIMTNSEKTAADLSFFRILFFGFFAIGIIINPSAISDQVQPFLNFPESAQVTLPFMGWYPKVVPINETMVKVVSVVLYISIFTSFLGFKTRWSILLFTLTLFYLFTIPNLFGKVNHNHHLIWFPAILCFSPCADRFSLDAYFGNRSVKSTLRPKQAYTLPFLLIWILIGLIYFFPGFWKMWSLGLDWALTDNVRNQMYYKWFALGDKSSWLPFFRIDQYPLLFKASGIYTLVFEIAFIPLMLNRSTRIVAIALGIGFHVGTYLFMHIFFIVLVWSYLSFVNWHTLSIFNKRLNSSSFSNDSLDFKLTKWTGILLISSCILFGFGKWYSWPFTVYPTFDTLMKEETQHLIYIGETTGSSIELNNASLYMEYTSPRYWEMEYDIIEEANKGKLDTVLLNRFVSIYADKSDKLQRVKVYIEQQSIIPEKRKASPRKLIYSKDCY